MIAFDTNILIYAELPSSADVRHEQAAALLARAVLYGAVMPLQVLGEFLSVTRRKSIMTGSLALKRAEIYASVFETRASSLDDLVDAQGLAATYQLQFFRRRHHRCRAPRRGDTFAERRYARWVGH